MLAGLPSQCHDYKTLNETSRHYKKPGGCKSDVGCDVGCDGVLDMYRTSPQWRGAGWYRFAGAAGTKMATKSEVTKYSICGTAVAGHLNTNGHPYLAEGQSQKQKVCFYGFYGQKSQCYRSTTVTIQRCDGFFIYKLPNTPSCSYRYCGA